jgi:hypothetical protein
LDAGYDPPSCGFPGKITASVRRDRRWGKRNSGYVKFGVMGEIGCLGDLVEGNGGQRRECEIPTHVLGRDRTDA